MKKFIALALSVASLVAAAEMALAPGTMKHKYIAPNDYVTTNAWMTVSNKVDALAIQRAQQYGGGGGGSVAGVQSVNGKTGTVVLVASDVGAITKSSADDRYQSKVSQATDVGPGGIVIGRGLEPRMNVGTYSNPIKNKFRQFYIMSGDNRIYFFVSEYDYQNRYSKGIGSVYYIVSDVYGDHMVQRTNAYFDYDLSIVPQGEDFYIEGMHREHFWTQSILESIDTGTRKIEVSMFENYSSSKGYAYGQVCLHDNMPYRCVYGYNYTGETWNPSHWVPMHSNNGIWDPALQVWWSAVMNNGKLTYQATTNVNLNAVN